MAFESWDDAMFWHGSLIGYMAGVKSACKDEDKSSLLLRMADTQARLEFMESENAKLREQVRDVWHLFTEHGAVHQCDLPVVDAVRDRMRELGIEVADA